MDCHSCGHENIENARFCAGCGTSLQAEEEEEHNWIGRTVGGRFKVNSVLGEGGMGIVYEGEQQMGSNVRRVAIKTLHSHLSKDESVLARFHRECGTVSQLEHPNTIKFYDFGKEDDGTLYIAMEFIDGQSMDDVIVKEGPLAPTRVAKIMEQVCGALDEAHDLGVIHRDLKPENIVLTERLGEKDFVKVLDFGIAARTESADAQKEAKLTQQGMVLGTPPYMSPEQFTGAELERRSDVYSLGVMAYEMLTGELPFTANTPWQWATEHMTAQPFPISERASGSAVPKAMRDAVMGALAKDPAERPGSAGSFLAQLKDGLAGAGLSGPASAASISAATEEMQAAPVFSAAQGAATHETQSVMSATQPVEVPVKKSKAGAIVAMLALVALGGVGAVLAMGGDESSESEDPDQAASASPDGEEPSEKKVEESDEKSEPEAKTDEPADAEAPKPSTSPAPKNDPAPKSDPAPKPQPAPVTTPQVAPKPQPTQPAVCTSCSSMLRSGRFAEVASQMKACPSSAQSACRSTASQVASQQIDSAAKRKDCRRAQSWLAKASQMGVANGGMRKKVAKCGK